MTDSLLIATLVTQNPQSPLQRSLWLSLVTSEAAVRSDQVAQGFTQPGFGKLLKTETAQPPWQPVPLPACYIGEKFLLMSSKNFSYFSLFLLSVIPLPCMAVKSPTSSSWCPLHSLRVAVRCLQNDLCTRLDNSQFSHLCSWSNALALIILMASAKLAPVC